MCGESLISGALHIVNRQEATKARRRNFAGYLSCKDSRSTRSLNNYRGEQIMSQTHGSRVLSQWQLLSLVGVPHNLFWVARF